MEISSKTFREVEFREKRHGYHPEDVDKFLEEMALASDIINQRLQLAEERAQRSQSAPSEPIGDDDALRRTLVLAQRTADLAIQESREQAAEIVLAAEEEARATRARAEAEARRLQDETLAEVRDELARLESARARVADEVDELRRWAGEQRLRLVAALQEAIVSVEHAADVAPPETDPASSSPQPGAGAPDETGVAVVASPEPSGHAWDGQEDGDTAVLAAEVPPGEAGRSGEAAGGGEAVGGGETVHSGETVLAGETMDAGETVDKGYPGAVGGLQAAPPPPGVLDGAVAGAGGALPPPPPPAVPVGVGRPVVTIGPGTAFAASDPTSAQGTAAGGPAGPRERNPLTDPDETAIEHFFEGGEPGDDRRFGLLRRRR